MAAAPTISDARAVLMQGTVFREQTMIDSVVRDPIYMWQTDSFVSVEQGPLAAVTANVQNYMSMTYFFTRYVRDLGVISMEDAVAKASSMPRKRWPIISSLTPRSFGTTN